MKQYIVSGMSCAACQAHVEKAVQKLPDVKSVSVSLLTNSMAVEGQASDEEIMKAVEDAGYGAKPKEEVFQEYGGEASKADNTASISKTIAAEEDALKDRQTPKLLRRLKLSVGFLVILMYFTMGHNMLGWPVLPFLNHNHIGLSILQMLIALIVMYINRDFFISGFRSLAHRAPNMDALVALGSSVSFAWSLYILFRMTWMVTKGVANIDLMPLYHDQLYFESAAMIPALITVGKTLESYSKGRTTDALKNLVKMAPKTAVLERDGKEVEVGIDEVKCGDIFIVKPGSSVPVDGVIVEGQSTIDESALTGESIPVDKGVGDRVSAATINRSGYFKARATRIGRDTAFAQIIQMVSDAAATKAPIARVADRVSSVFVPTVMAIALIVGIIWLILGRGPAFAVEKAIAVLVVSCPCALGLATPVAIMVGNGVGARNGILFKTSEALENAGTLKTVALDKTGTMTMGQPHVTDIIPAEGINETELLTTAFALEQKSEHPLARAVVEAADQRGIPKSPLSDFKALSGHGLTGVLDGETLYGGSGSFLKSLTYVPASLQKKADELSSQGKTPLFFARGQEILGLIAVADVIKEDSARAVKEMQKMGIKVVMITGDNEKTAHAIGREAGVDRVIAGVLPKGKEAAIRDLQKEGRVAMVGDGINDAPALMRSDVGIAIGAGTDVAIDSADIVLMNSKLTDASAAIRLSRATLRNIHENLFWAFAYNIILIPVAAGLYAHWGVNMNPMWGAAAMALSSFTVCMNALRINLFHVHKADESGDEKKVEQREKPEHRETDKRKTDKRKTDNQEIENRNTENKEKENRTMTKTIKVNGMMCHNCENHVKKALEALDNVSSASADHEKNIAVIETTGPVSEDAVRQAIIDEGYEFGGME
ncbi:MAG: heavy metal translocating P-type ATPase [Lachnospiraceae bacterium]|nr:heavy metal translocating P-type ATPase [Lachnospiraceae bacterium]